MNDLVANIVGSAAAICSITSFAPQGIKIWKERDASSVSLKTYSLTVSCFILWVVYGVMTQAWPVTVSNSAFHEVALPRRRPESGRSLNAKRSALRRERPR